MSAEFSEKELFLIGTVAKSFGVSDNTIRRMEKAGLLAPALVKDSGYRYYDQENISRIKMILALRSFGFVYEDMRKFFESPWDFSQVYDKLYEKKLLLDELLKNTKLYIRPENSDDVFLIQHESIPFFTRVYPITERISMEFLDELATKAFHEAIRKKQPVDYSRPITILSDCMDYMKFRPLELKELTFLVPLRKEARDSSSYVMPARKVVSFAWYYGLSIAEPMDNLSKFMSEHNYVQCGPVGGTLEVGTYMGHAIEKQNYLFHIMIPIEEGAKE